RLGLFWERSTQGGAPFTSLAMGLFSPVPLARGPAFTWKRRFSFKLAPVPQYPIGRGGGHGVIVLVHLRQRTARAAERPAEEQLGGAVRRAVRGGPPPAGSWSAVPPVGPPAAAIRSHRGRRIRSRRR